MSASRRRDFSRKQKRLRADTAKRLEAIVEAAERAAERVLDEAEAEGRRYLAAAKAEADRMTGDRLADVVDLIDALAGQAASLRRDAERLQQALEATQARLGDSPPTAGPPEQVPPVETEPSPAARPPRLRAVTDPEGAPAGAAGDRDRAAGARLLATQLAVSGSSREEIAARLRTGFEIEDTSAILDAILGPED